MKGEVLARRVLEENLCLQAVGKSLLWSRWIDCQLFTELSASSFDG